TRPVAQASRLWRFPQAGRLCYGPGQDVRGDTTGKKWMPAELTLGAIMETTFWPNPVKGSGFRFRATHLHRRKAPKDVLCDDVRIRAGTPCQVRLKAIHKLNRDDRGYIEAEFVKQQEFKIEGVYLDPVIAKKLQVLLESGLNILMFGHDHKSATVIES